jgi:hypothetical protein
MTSEGYTERVVFDGLPGGSGWAFYGRDYQ